MFKDKAILYIFLASCLLFIPFLGSVHLFDWDEINFAECAREMIVSKDYLRTQIDFKPFWLGFLSGALVWLISAIWMAQTHPSSLSEKMASILPLGGNVILLYVCTAIVGGLIGGVWTLAGAKLRAK